MLQMFEHHRQFPAQAGCNLVHWRSLYIRVSSERHCDDYSGPFFYPDALDGVESNANLNSKFHRIPDVHVVSEFLGERQWIP